MSPLTEVAIALGLGWIVFWALLSRQARRQSELEKKIEALELSQGADPASESMHGRGQSKDPA